MNGLKPAVICNSWANTWADACIFWVCLLGFWREISCWGSVCCISFGRCEHSEMRLPGGYRETTNTLFYTIRSIAWSPIAVMPWGFKQGWLQKRSMGIGPWRINSKSLDGKPMHSGNCLKHHAEERKSKCNHYSYENSCWCTGRRLWCHRRVTAAGICF